VFRSFDGRSEIQKYHAVVLGNTFLIFYVLSSKKLSRPYILKNTLGKLVESDADSALIFQAMQQDHKVSVITMEVLEKNGTFSSFCGNGALVSAQLLKAVGLQDVTEFILQCQSLRAHVNTSKFFIDVSMGLREVSVTPYRLNLDTSLENISDLLVLDTCFICQRPEPHLVIVCDVSLQHLQVLGEYFNRLSYSRDHPFADGINVTQVTRLFANNRMRIVTYERGVNAVTASCGTGALSAARVAAFAGWVDGNRPIEVHAKGGDHLVHVGRGSIVLSALNTAVRLRRS